MSLSLNNHEASVTKTLSDPLGPLYPIVELQIVQSIDVKDVEIQFPWHHYISLCVIHLEEF